jgi:hypothetical protein
MKMIAKVVAILCLGSMLCLAENWTGKLVDAGCKDQAKPAPADPSNPQAMKACEPTEATATFGIELSDGRVLKLDNAGNVKAAEVAKTNSTKQPMLVIVKGTLNGSMVTVESIEIQQ